MVPEGWENLTLGFLGRWQGGGTPSKANEEYWTDGTIPWISPKDMKVKNIETAEDYITDLAIKNSSTNLVPKDCVLVVTRSGILRHTVPVAINVVPVAINQDLKALIPGNGVNVKYIANYLWMNSQTLISQCAKDGTTVESIDFQALKRFPISLPPLEEQRKIAEILSTWDNAIEKLERLIEKKQEHKRGLMQVLLTGKVRFKEFASNTSRSIRKGYFESKLGDLPDEWHVVKIPDILFFQEGPGVQKHQFTSQGVKLINGSNIQQAKLDLSNTARYISEHEAYGKYKHFLLDPGDLVIASSGIAVNKFEEKIAFVSKDDLPLCMNTSTIRFKSLDESKADIMYFKYFMMTPLFKSQIRRSITGSAQLNFGPTHLDKAFVVLPPLKEQQKIAAVLSAADAEIETLQKQLAAYKEQKRGLMQQLLTGKTRVQVEAEAA